MKAVIRLEFNTEEHRVMVTKAADATFDINAREQLYIMLTTTLSPPVQSNLHTPLWRHI